MRLSAEDKEIIHTLLQDLKRIADNTSALVDNSGLLNGVYNVELVEFDEQGVITRSYHGTIASVGILNHGDNAIIYSTGLPMATAPYGGVGVHRIEPLSAVTIPVGAHEFTLYGTEGDKISLQVLNRIDTPIASIL